MSLECELLPERAGIIGVSGPLARIRNFSTLVSSYARLRDTQAVMKGSPRSFDDIVYLFFIWAQSQRSHSWG